MNLLSGQIIKIYKIFNVFNKNIIFIFFLLDKNDFVYRKKYYRSIFK